MVQCKKCLIEARLVNSTAAERLPKSRGKGAGAEADVVATVPLAVRRISALLSLMRRAIQYRLPFSGAVVVAFAAAFFHLVYYNRGIKI